MDCLFCKIVAGEIPSNKVYEDEKILAFHDVSPQADTHVLVIPKTHIANLNEVNATNSAVITHLFEKIPEIAKLAGVTDYRLISNCGAGAGQSVHHLHFHLLSGDNLAEALVGGVK